MSAQLDNERRLYAKDLDGRYFYANESFAKDAGIPLALLLGRTDFDLAWANQAEKLRAEDAQIIERGYDTHRVEMLATAKRKMKIIKRKVIVRDETGKVFGIAGIYIPYAMRDQKRRCSDCRSKAARQLEIALSMLTPVQMASYEEQAEAIDDDERADEPTLF